MAESCYSRSLAIKQQALGSSHPSVAATVNKYTACFKRRTTKLGVLQRNKSSGERAESIFGVSTFLLALPRVTLRRKDNELDRNRPRGRDVCHSAASRMHSTSCALRRRLTRSHPRFTGLWLSS